MKKGISLIVLFIVVLVIIILATTLTVTGINVYNNSRITRFATELAYVKEALDAYRMQNNGMYPIKDAVVLDISQVSSKAKVQFQDENITDNKVTLYEIDFSLLGVNELSYGNQKEGDKTDMYVVSMDTSNVYYAKGYKVNNNTYYTLTDELKEAIGYNINENAINKDGIIFKPSTTEWTNKNVEVEVLVPKVYTSVTITAKKGNQVTKTINSGVTEGDYVTYSVTGIQGNYDIEVKYQKEGSVKEQLYQITNVDNVAPTLEIVSQSKMVNEDKSDKKTVIEIKVTDDLSQIAFAKYEDDNIPENIAKQYFSGNGKTVNDNMLIEVDRYTTDVSIYIQDKAGNGTYKQIRLDATATENDYVKSGIILHLDAINNTGNGHSSNTTIWKDLSGNKRDATLKSFNFTQNSGWNENSLLLDGVDDYVNLGDIKLDRFTIEIVFKFKTIPTTNFTTIISNFEGAGFGYEYSNVSEAPNIKGFYFQMFTNELNDYDRIYDNRQVDTTTINVLSSSFSGDKLTYFSNGRFTQKEDKSNIKSSDVNMLIGANPTLDNIADTNYTEQGFLNAYIYSVRIYNRALTEKEVMQNYKVDKIRYGV